MIQKRGKVVVQNMAFRKEETYSVTGILREDQIFSCLSLSPIHLLTLFSMSPPHQLAAGSASPICASNIRPSAGHLSGCFKYPLSLPLCVCVTTPSLLLRRTTLQP